MNPQETLYHGMRLQLNENSCLESSSSTSSPDSMRSLSSLDLPEGLIERKTASSEDDSGIQSPDSRPDDNENSVSIYLDANENGWDSNCEDKDNVSLILNSNQDLDYEVNEKQDAARRDSSATEAPLVSSEDEDSEDEEEDSFLSMSSVDVGMKAQFEERQVWSLSRRTSDAEDLQKSMEHQNQETLIKNLPKRSDIKLITFHQMDVVESAGLQSRGEQPQSSNRRPNVDLPLNVQEENLQVSKEIQNKDQITNLSRSPSMEIKLDVNQEAAQESKELSNNDDQTRILSREPSVGLLFAVQQEALQEPEDRFNNDSQSKGNQSKEPDCDNIQLQILTEDPVTMIQQETSKEKVLVNTKLILESDSERTLPAQNSAESPCVSEAFRKQAPTGTSRKPSPNNTNKMDLKRSSRFDLKTIKPRVLSRAASVTSPVNSDIRHPASGNEKKVLPIRGRAASRTQEAENLRKKGRSASSLARVTVSDTKSQSLQPQMAKDPSLAINREHTSSEFSGIREHNAHSTAVEQVRDEGHSGKKDVKLQDTPIVAGQSVSSGLRAPMVAPRVPNQGCLPAGCRPTSAAGFSKMKMIDSPAPPCGSASSWKTPHKPTSSKLPIKTSSVSTSLSSSSVGSAASENITNKGAGQVIKNEEPCLRPTSSILGKVVTMNPVAAANRNKANPVAKPSFAAQKATSHTAQSKVTQNGPQRGGSAKSSRPSGTVCPSSKGSRGKRVLQKHTEEEEEKKNQIILQLRRLVAHGNRRLEALAVVIQQVFSEREEAQKQKKEASFQLKNLREELAQSLVCCERLESEKASVCAQLDAAVVKLQEQHQEELVQLEETLREFYSTEWDKAHQVYQDEADRCRELMKQQVEEVRSKQEALRRDQEVAHAQKMEALSQKYESTLAELQKIHEENKQELNNKLQQSETALNERIESLRLQNDVLSNRLREEEEKRKLFADKNQKDSQVQYLEQEMESLKVVLELKIEQLHQQDKKLMQMDKLIDTNVQLEEFVKKLQQENEDYKERINKHTAISRQLSTEQAMLQKTLQKESKANKRLSMENEELLWKLHNGLSPRNSACFSSPPVSPR